MIVHNECGGTIRFETRQEALAALASAGQAPPPAPREFRQFYCDRCLRFWRKKGDMWREAHPEPDA